MRRKKQDKVGKNKEKKYDHSTKRDSNKPFSGKELLSRIKEILDNNNYVGAQNIEIEHSEAPSGEAIKTLKEDLQIKLNKAKLQIKSLQEQIKKDQMARSPEQNGTQKELEGKLKMQREMAIFLQKQLETKVGDIETFKNVAVQIKRKYRHLENDVRVKDQKILESAENIIKSHMREQSVNKLTIERKYLPEIFSADILDISKDGGLPILKPFVIEYFRSKGIITEFYGNVIKFIKQQELNCKFCGSKLVKEQKICPVCGKMII